MSTFLPVIAVRVTPQTLGQFRYWQKHINQVKSAQDTAGSGSVLDVNYPVVDIMMPVPRTKTAWDIIRR